MGQVASFCCGQDHPNASFGGDLAITYTQGGEHVNMMQGLNYLGLDETQLQEYQSESQYEDQYADSLTSEEVSLRQYQQLPYSNVGVICCSEDESMIQSCHGSGFAIGEDLILTAFHNIYNKSRKKVFSYLTFLHEFYQTKKVQYKVIDYRFCKEYLSLHSLNKKESAKYDYAILKLDRKLQKVSFGINLISNFSNQEQNISICGYPKQRLNAGKMFINKMERFVGDKTNSIIRIYVEGKVIHYKLQSSPGQSGSPIYFIGEQNKVYIIALHKGKVKTNDEAKCGAGILFSTALIRNVKKWTLQLKSVFRCKVQDYMTFKDHQLSRSSLSIKIPKKIKTLQDNQRPLFPYRYVGRVQTEHQSKAILTGTCFLISQNLAITSNSCIYDSSMKSEAFQLETFKKQVKISVFFSLDGEQEDAFEVQQFCMNEEYIRGYQDQSYASRSALPFHNNQLVFLNFHDYCLLKLKKKVSGGPFLRLLVNHNKIDLSKYKLIGLTYGLPHKECKSQINNFDVQIIPDKQILRYTIGSSSGIFGSPILYQNSVIGYHKCSNILGESFGRFVTSQMVQTLYKWQKNMQASQFKVNYQIKKQLHSLIVETKDKADFLSLQNEQLPVSYY